MTPGAMALRQLVRAPLSWAAAVLVQGVGIAGTLVILALALGVHERRPSGIEDPRHEILDVSRIDREAPGWREFPWGSYQAIREEAATLSDVAASIGPFGALLLRAGDRLEGARVGLATGNHLRVLGVRPVRGRGFSPDDERVGAPPVCLLSDRLARRLGIEERIPGATVVASERTVTVVGTLPDDFRGLHDSDQIEIWLPVGQYPILAPNNPEYDPFSGRVWQFRLVARLAPGATGAAAATELTAIQRRIVRESYPDKDASADRVDVEPLLAFAHYERRRFRVTALLLALPAGLVLGMTVLNVAGLGMARALRRQREAAIRLSVGASPWRIVRERLAEGLGTAPAAAVVGLVAALGILELLEAVAVPLFRPLVEAATLASGWTPLFVVGVSSASALASGLLPAWSAGRTAPLVVLQGGDWTQRRSTRARRSLLVGQTALVTVLAVVGAASARSLWKARNDAPGFDPHGLSVTRVDPMPKGYDKPEALRFARRLLENLNAAPRVQSATLSRMNPVRAIVLGRMAVVDPEGGPDRPVGSVAYDEVAPGYFEVLSIPVVAGRPFRWTNEHEGAPEIVVNAAAARRWPWPDGRALGSRVRLSEGGVPHTVVGVVGDVRSRGVLAPAPPFAYLPLFQRLERNVFDLYGFAVHLRRATGPDAAVHPVVAAVRALDPEMPVETPQTIAAIVAETLPLETMLEGLASAAAALALVIVALGLFASASQISAERVHEFGVRLALGARPADLGLQVLRWSGVTLGIGLAAGVAAGAAIAPRLAASQGVFLSADGVVAGGVGALVFVVGLAAAAVPAWRAVRTDPVDALRLPPERA